MGMSTAPGKARRTRLTVTEVGDPHVLALRIYEGDEGGRAIEAELHFLVVLETVVVVVDDRPNFSV